MEPEGDTGKRTGAQATELVRVQLLEELNRMYGGGAGGRRWRFLRKRYAWSLVTGGARVLKRVLDVMVSLVFLVVSLPLLLLVAFLIKLTDGGPVIFWQVRVGRYGREFDFPKFRSMVMNAETIKEQLLAHSHHGGESITFKMRDDPRITWIGKISRKFSLDEMPQLWCVFKGDMSLVGPRPPLPREVVLYTLADRRRLDVTPGLTCIWQVSGRGDIPFERQCQLDMEYIQSQSLWLDFKILLKTIPAVLLGKGAY